MQSIKDSVFYGEVLKELNYSFGDFYLFDGFFVSEIKSGTDFSWENAKVAIEDITPFYQSDGSDVVYISNRINDYNVKPVDWFKFTMYAFKLHGYGIVVKNKLARKNANFESIFIPVKFKTFNDVFEAIQWVAIINDKKKEKRKRKKKERKGE
ncbi:hypothetical protein LY01_00232 [Nonlabens xylanidelens]|uniref:SpoIIAA-like protein n=1 Tax=Nonlabens xylanidelens TaxID=191564 RepID=A0A2S6IQ82_9FLAO|nr:hypothetical protein [Nonlabens xylanidelens]PPK96412.1 hypothetical protein LY01_00232 [Nonlabens xylanidelens]PQJ18137.1 hypothetical protein BST94_09010 [Nonlabens xylanidelens]